MHHHANLPTDHHANLPDCSATKKDDLAAALVDALLADDLALCDLFPGVVIPDPDTNHNPNPNAANPNSNPNPDATNTNPDPNPNPNPNTNPNPNPNAANPNPNPNAANPNAANPNPNPDTNPNPNPNPNTANPTDTTTPEDEPNPGDCYEVWWEYEEQWYACVVKSQSLDVGGSIASLCYYDDGQSRWHNLPEEKIRRIKPTHARIKKLTIREIRKRLRAEGISPRTTWRKPKLVSTLLSKLLVGGDTNPNPTTTTTANPPTNPNPTTTTTANPTTTTIPHPHPNPNPNPTTTTTTTNPNPPTTILERAKYGQSHAQRVILRKRKSADNEQVEKEQAETKRLRTRCVTRKRKMTTEVCECGVATGVCCV